jgi:uncharacterized ubiquitin-like protein YukD
MFLRILKYRDYSKLIKKRGPNLAFITLKKIYIYLYYQLAYRKQPMKLNAVILNEATHLYTSDKNFKEIASILGKKFGITISQEGIRKRFVKLKIPRRTNSEAVKLARRKHLPTNQILDLYQNKKLSLRKLAKRFNSSKETLHKIIKENNLEVRENEVATRLSNLRYIKPKINLDSNEKAYLIGLVKGDLTAYAKSKYTLRLITNSTNKEFINLLKNLLKNYGHVHIYQTKVPRQKCILADFDMNYFGFLLWAKKPYSLISSSKNSEFLSFLAGLIDAEGSIMFKKSNKQYVIRIYNEDIILLKKVKARLENLNYTPYIYKNGNKGETRFYLGKIIVYNKDYYALQLSKKDEILRLLKNLKLRHPDKIKKQNFLFQIAKK